MAARGALEQGQGVGVAVGGQGGHEGGQLGAVPALPAPAGGLVVAHGPRQLGPVHAHGQGEQALVGDRRAGEELVVVAVGALHVPGQRHGRLAARAVLLLRADRPGEVPLRPVVVPPPLELGVGARLLLGRADGVLGDPGPQHVGAEGGGVGRVEAVQVELEHAVAAGVLEPVRQDDPPAGHPRVDGGPVGPPQRRQGVGVEPGQGCRGSPLQAALGLRLQGPRRDQLGGALIAGRERAQQRGPRSRRGLPGQGLAQGDDGGRVGELGQPLRRGLALLRPSRQGPGGQVPDPRGVGPGAVRALARPADRSGPRVAGHDPPRQGPVDRGGADGDLHQGRQDLLGDGGHVLQGLQRLGGQAGVPEALDDQVGVGQRPRPDAVRVVVVPQPVVEPGRPVAFGQVGRPEDLFDRPRVEALDGGVVQQCREVGSSRAGLDPGPVQQVQAGAVLDDCADVMGLEAGRDLAPRAVGDGDEPVDVGVGDLLQPAALPVMGVGVVLGALADPGVDPLAQLRLGGGGRGRVQQGGEGRRFDGRARIRPGPCLRLLVRPRLGCGAPTRARPANRPVIRPGDGAAIRGPVGPTTRSRWCRVGGIGLGHGAPSVGGEGGSAGWDRGAGTLPPVRVATVRRHRAAQSAGALGRGTDGARSGSRGVGLGASVSASGARRAPSGQWCPVERGRVTPRCRAESRSQGAPSSAGACRRARRRLRAIPRPCRTRGIRGSTGPGGRHGEGPRGNHHRAKGLASVAVHCQGSDVGKRWLALIFHPPPHAPPVLKWRNDAVPHARTSADTPERYAPATFSGPSRPADASGALHARELPRRRRRRRPPGTRGAARARAPGRGPRDRRVTAEIVT